MNIKEFLKPSINKIVTFLILLVVEFFILPILALLVYSPKLGAKYVPTNTFCTLFQSFTDEGLGSCNLFYGSYIYILFAVILTYLIVCFLVSKISKKKQKQIALRHTFSLISFARTLPGQFGSGVNSLSLVPRASLRQGKLTSLVPILLGHSFYSYGRARKIIFSLFPILRDTHFLQTFF